MCTRAGRPSWARSRPGGAVPNPNATLCTGEPSSRLTHEEVMAFSPGNQKTRAPHVAIACQGSGSHAAFGAGIMHRLLEDHGRTFRLSALSGTSGGAVNAVLAWSGL